MKILILGGYGVFGGRLTQLLADIPDLTMLICGRDVARARRFSAGFVGQAKVIPVGLDRKDLGAALDEHRPDLVIDASGPFQDYGARQYAVIEACIAAKISYLDFADAADFVFGVSRYQREAELAGVFVLSGVSSFPVLTAAVLRQMAQAMDIVEVEGGIAPSPYAGIGLNVMRAVIGYAGAPVKLMRGGKQTHAMGLAESRRTTIAVPGRLPLRNLRFSLVDVPDLRVLPPEHPTMTDIWMGAGPVPELLHRILNLLAMARARLGLPSLVRFSGLFYFVLNLMKFGEHRGGMYVRAKGVSRGVPVEQSWHLLAEGNDGPLIPSMAIEAIIRKLIVGDRPAPGARPATRALDLADYDRLFANRAITTGFRSERSGTAHQRILGSAFEALPLQVRKLHGMATHHIWRGTADVRRGMGIAASLIAWAFRFPEAGKAVPVTVIIKPDVGGERWVRNFAGRTFEVHLAAGTGLDDYLLIERLGVASVALALVVEGDRLFLLPRRWKLFGVPMPSALAPRGISFESEEDGRFCFDVSIVLPLVGLIVAYNGSLDMVD
jgi:hypothetical protein